MKEKKCKINMYLNEKSQDYVDTLCLSKFPVVDLPKVVLNLIMVIMIPSLRLNTLSGYRTSS